jgi:hypothetical protein
MSPNAAVESPNSNQPQNQLLPFSPAAGVRIEAAFDEPRMTSDGGAILLREVTRENGLISAMASAINDPRSQAHVKHSIKEMIAQRTIQICLGYEDVNDCDTMRNDLALKTAVERPAPDDLLASQPTVTRLENCITQADIDSLFDVFVENFLDSYPVQPGSMILDMDPTAIRTYGHQELALFNSHYGGYCLMPFHIYEGQSGKLIATVIREGKTPGKDEIVDLLERLVTRIRARFSRTRLIFRADSHHTKPAVLTWLERNKVHYVLGLATNAVLQREVEATCAGLEKAYADVDRIHQPKVRKHHEFYYAAESWGKNLRRVVARVEIGFLGTDSRFVVTDLTSCTPKYLYEKVYCDRANAELMIKEHKCHLFSDRMSCRSKRANQFRLMLHSAAYVLMHRFRERMLAGTRLARATFQTIRLRLFKLAARVEVKKTIVRFHFSKEVDPIVPEIFGRLSQFAMQ